MKNTQTNIWIHAIWSTRDSAPLMKDVFRTQIKAHLRYKLEETGCRVRIINGTADHVHALFQLGQKASLERVMDHVKSESSRWINQQKFLNMPFAWQVGYLGISVSASMLWRVEKYIRNQQNYHKQRAYSEELNQFVEKLKAAG